MTDGDRTGSRLWLLSREKTLPEVLRRAHDYAFEALIWLVDDGIARAVDVDATMPRPGLLALAVKIFLPGQEFHLQNGAWPCLLNAHPWGNSLLAPRLT